MKKLLFLLIFIPFVCSAQIYDHNRVFSDTLEYTDFNQGYLDAQAHFNGTRDVFLGVGGLSPYVIGFTAISYFSKPKDKRLLRGNNLNKEYLYSNVDYYNGYKYGANKKKRKRIRQGFFGTLGVGLVTTIGALFYVSTLVR